MTTLATQQPTMLSVFKDAGIAPSNYDDAAFSKMASAGGYLPRLTQFTDASAVCKKKELTPGFYLVTGKDDRAPLGEDVDVVPVAWRFKALDTSANRPISSIDPNSDLFKAIAARAKGPNSHCQAGIEFLMWVPAVSKFATFLMGSKTALKEAAKLKPFMGAPCTIKTHTFENEEHIWQGPKVFNCDVPPSAQPDLALLKETIETFKNPPAAAAEDVVDEAKDSAKPARKR